MSNQEEKFKHSKRILKTASVVKKQLKIANRYFPNKKVSEQPHRLAKRHAMDCGRPNCMLCGNPRKLHKDKLTYQEKRLFQNTELTIDKKSNGLKREIG